VAVLVTAPRRGRRRWHLPAATMPLTIAPEKATVGQEVQVTGQSLPPGRTLTWSGETVDGGWVVESYFFRGKNSWKAPSRWAGFGSAPTGGLNARL
jgi:hypothetical protein